MHGVGAIDVQTMRKFDANCLMPVQAMPPERIRALREREHLSQPVFALYLNVSKNPISDWERGIKKPVGPALRLADPCGKEWCPRHYLIVIAVDSSGLTQMEYLR